MKYHVTLDGESLEIELIEKDGALFVERDGEAVPVELCPIHGRGTYSLLVGDKSLPVTASGPNDDLVLNLGSETWHATVLDAREKAAQAAEGGRGRRKSGGKVRSVMPGIVRELRVAAGDEVAAGDPLLILEAMKMQNEIRAEMDGVIGTVHVEAGQAVAKGNPLVSFKS